MSSMCLSPVFQKVFHRSVTSWAFVNANVATLISPSSVKELISSCSVQMVDRQQSLPRKYVLVYLIIVKLVSTASICTYTINKNWQYGLCI